MNTVLQFFHQLFNLSEPSGIAAAVSILILICACSSKISSKIHLPVLLVFLGVGIFAGMKEFSGVDFKAIPEMLLNSGPGTLFSKKIIDISSMVGTYAMAYILFSGGFSTRWSEVKSVLREGLLLSTVGVFLTAFFVGIMSFYIIVLLEPEGKLTFSWCFLLGSIISSTDAAAVFSILRSRSVSLKGELRPLLELESGSNDPMAAFLTIFLIGVVIAERKTGIPYQPLQYLSIIPQFAMKMGIGIGVGLTIGWLIVRLYNWIDFDYDGLYYVLAVATAMISFSVTECLFGNGFMAVYVTGLYMGNHRFIYHNGVGRFSDGMAWLMQVILFAMLGLFANPEKLWSAKWQGLVISFVLMFLARPIAVMLCLTGSRFSMKERILISWVGLRGGAPIMLAILPLAHSIESSDRLFNIVFFTVIASVISQGTTLMPLARLLNLHSPIRNDVRRPIQFEETNNLSEVTSDILIPEHSSAVEKDIASLGLPQGAHVLLIRRGNGFVMPHGATVVYAGDQLMIMGNQDVLDRAEKLLTDNG